MLKAVLLERRSVWQKEMLRTTSSNCRSMAFGIVSGAAWKSKKDGKDSITLVLDCGAAHVKQPYTVENAPNQILINIKNGASPFTLALQSNGTLTGSGNAAIAGRVVTGATQNALTYAPKTASCAIGTLAPQGGPR